MKIKSFIVAVGGIAVVTAILVLFQNAVSPTTVALSFLLVVLLTATFFGRNPALLASVLGTLCFNFFFLPPFYTFTIADSNNWIALFAFLITSVVAGQLFAYAEKRTAESERLFQELQEVFEKASHAEALKQSERLKSALLDAVTHDLRTPLTSIKAAITTIIDDNKKEGAEFRLDDEGRREFFEVINEETDRLNRFIENMVELARIEAGAMRLRRNWSEVEEIIRAALERLEKKLKTHQIRLEIERELPAVQVDARALAEVVHILLDNAAKYSLENSKIVISARRAENEMIKIAVTDEGRGVLPEMREKVFEKFFQVSLDNEQDIAAAGGLGMGLAVARGIVEAHDGKIWIETGDNKTGTKIILTVPIGDEEK